MRLARSLLKSSGGRRLGLIKGQKGYMLIEVIVAVAIIGVVAVAFLSALTSGYLALVLADENTVAESLTRSEFERVRDAGYPASSDNRTVLGYEVRRLTEFLPVGSGGVSPIQQVTVEVYHGDPDQPLLVTQSYKVDPNKNLPS